MIPTMMELVMAAKTGKPIEIDGETYIVEEAYLEGRLERNGEVIRLDDCDLKGGADDE